MKQTVLDLTIFLSLFGTGATFLRSTPNLCSRLPVKSFMSMAATSSLGGITYRVSNVQQSIDFYTSVFGMKVLESDAQSSSARLMMDSTEGGQSAMTLELLSGFARDSSEMGDVSVCALSCIV